MIVQALQQVQERHGYLPTEELHKVATWAGVPLYRVQEVASFFPHFRRDSNPPTVIVRVCQSMTCNLCGSREIFESVRKKFTSQIETGRLEIEQVPCLGRCDQAPVACVASHDDPAHRESAQRGAAQRGTHHEHYYHDDFYGDLNNRDATRQLPAILDATLAGNVPQVAPIHMIERAQGTAWQIDVYDPRHADRIEQPYSGVRQFLETSDRDGLTAARSQIMKNIETAGLVGMGGAAARTGKKWKDVLDAAGDEKYIVCNGDESEPGTFKDREILGRSPHLVIEGMLLAGLYLRAKRGYIYIRHEYPEQIQSVRNALQAAYSNEDAAKALRACPLEVFVSPGNYICGEETALLEVIEDRRAQPRNAPPDIRTNGLFDKPTVVNNVETYAWVPSIALKEEGKWFQQAGLRFFSISGNVKKPGVYEVPVQATLGQLINDYAGGMVDGLEFQAIATSGPSGGFLPAQLPAGPLRRNLKQAVPEIKKRSPMDGERVQKFWDKSIPDSAETVDVMDLELNVALFRALDLALGAGIVVYGQPIGKKQGFLQHALNCLEFFHDESCGKCIPCRLGCEQMVHLANDLQTGKQKPEQIETVAKALGEVMQVTSICGLGRTASKPMLTYLNYFKKELTAE